MQACVLPVWLCCLSLLLLLQKLLSTVCVISLWCLIFSYYFPTLCVCIHSRLCPLCICVNSACIDPACLCCFCWPCCAGLCHFDLSLSFVGVSANSACAHSLCLCELAVFVPTQSFCTLCDFLPTLCLCAHDVSLPTLLLSFCSLGCPFCLAVLFMSLLCLCFCCPLSD